MQQEITQLNETPTCKLNVPGFAKELRRNITCRSGNNQMGLSSDNKPGD